MIVRYTKQDTRLNAVYLPTVDQFVEGSNFEARMREREREAEKKIVSLGHTRVFSKRHALRVLVARVLK